MAGRKSDFTLPTNTLDELFSSQEERDEAKLSKIRDIPLEEIDDFPDHPFQVREDEDMFQLVESIKERGVITPATVRQKEDGRYELILNRITQNRAKGRNTFIFIDEIYLLFQHEYSANFLFTLWKRVRKYGAYATGITQNVDDLLQSHTARTMLANSEFIIMLNQASTDRLELAKLLNISDLQMSYITNVEAGHGLIKVGSSLVPFANKFPKNTKLYKLMTTKPGESA